MEALSDYAEDGKSQEEKLLSLLDYTEFLTESQDTSGREGAQDVSAATSCSRQVSSEVTPGCSGLHPIGAWRPPRMETPPPLTVLMGKKFLLISQLKLSCFNSCLLCLFLPPCTAVKSPSLSPWWPPCRHWGLLWGPLKPPLLQAEEGQLPQPLLKELRVEAKRRSGKTVVGPYYGATVLSGSLHVCPEAEERELCWRINGVVRPYIFNQQTTYWSRTSQSRRPTLKQLLARSWREIYSHFILL